MAINKVWRGAVTEVWRGLNHLNVQLEHSFVSQHRLYTYIDEGVKDKEQDCDLHVYQKKRRHGESCLVCRHPGTTKSLGGGVRTRY